MDLQLAIQDILVNTLQQLLTTGAGGVLILGYATRDLFANEEGPQPNGPKFASDYDELMWLAGRQKQHLDREETQRFYQLRHRWSEMHSFILAAQPAW